MQPHGPAQGQNGGVIRVEPIIPGRAFAALAAGLLGHVLPVPAQPLDPFGHILRPSRVAGILRLGGRAAVASAAATPVLVAVGSLQLLEVVAQASGKHIVLPAAATATVLQASHFAILLDETKF